MALVKCEGLEGALIQLATAAARSVATSRVALRNCPVTGDEQASTDAAAVASVVAVAAEADVVAVVDLVAAGDADKAPV